MEGNSHPSPRKPEAPKQDKPKVKHTKIHINQINQDQTQRANIKSSKGKTTNKTQGDVSKEKGQLLSLLVTCVHPWWIHVDIWQSQHNIVK